MTGLTAYTCTPRQTKKFAIRCMTAGLVPFIESSPAMGKSAIVRSIANDYGLQLIDHRLSTSAPEDLTGLPHFKDGKASFMPFDTFPTEDTPLPPGKNGWLLFLDEFNSASKAVQAAAYKLVLDKMVGLNKLHSQVAIICAGNLSTDRAIVNAIGTALQSRMIWLTMQLKTDAQGQHSEFMEDVAIPQKWDSRVIAYLSYKPSQLHDFQPDHSDKTFCAPRTWEFMSKLITGYEVLEEDAALYTGAITSGIAVEFIQFTKVYASLPKLKDIIDDPDRVDVPVDVATRYATITFLVEHSNPDNFAQITIYLGKFTAELRTLFFRILRIQKPDLLRLPAARAALVSISRYLHDDPAQHAA